MFSNPADPLNCFMDIQAGAGGTEAQDWASILLRQYLRYCEHKDFKTEVLEESDGAVAGIKSATIKIEGEYACGLLRTEPGGRAEERRAGKEWGSTRRPRRQPGNK